MSEKILVTQPYLPPLDEYEVYLKDIWESKWITNNGKFHVQLEKELAAYLGVRHLSLFSNGTIALLVALQALRIRGEVITTPYSFVATTHSLYWNNITPVFADIDTDFCNLDPDKIESLISNETTAIMPVHVYGNPCKADKIQEIADVYGLKVIYDAAHAFGVKYKGESILNYGDLSVLSFHATKIFNTFEGGAIISPDKKTKKRIDYLKNFGFADEVTVVGPGINGKMNEVQAAMGLLQLKHINEIIQKRKKIAELYFDLFSGIPGLNFIQPMDNVEYNYAYFPVFINKEKFGKSRDEVYEYMKTQDIYTRRYFYPLISKFPTYKDLSSASSRNLKVAEIKSNEVLCLPIYPDLEMSQVKRIAQLIINFR